MDESEWEIERMRLCHLLEAHPEWSRRALAEAMGHSESWVQKWRRRIRGQARITLKVFRSQSRIPNTRPRQVSQRVREVILSLRDQLQERYRRVIGPKTILYHLRTDPVLNEQHEFIPRSTHTVWRVLREGGRIARCVVEHHPVERPDPMQHWEMDFGQLSDRIEFLSVVDRGTSILVDTQAEPHYNAETALLAVARLLVWNGLPRTLRFDRDSRLVASWTVDGFPSPFVKFLLCLGIEPDPTPPRRPDLKPFVERSIRTLKYECLWPQHPNDAAHAQHLLSEFRQFYNQARPHQSDVCRNRPPYVAFPLLPNAPTLPDEVDPDAWLTHYHHQLFKRRVGANGGISIGRYFYYLGQSYASQSVALRLDALRRQFDVLLHGKLLKTLTIQGLVGLRLPFNDYLNLCLEEARSLERLRLASAAL